MKNLGIMLAAILVMAWGLLTSTAEIENQVDKRVESWEKVTDDAKTFSNSIRALGPTAKKFDQTFPDRSKAKDINSLYRLIGFEELGISGNPLTTRIVRIQDVEANKKVVGAIEVCIASGGGGYELRSDDMGKLIKGVDSLLEKPWVDASGISIKVIPGQRKISAILSDLCVVLSDKEYIKDLRQEGKA